MEILWTKRGYFGLLGNTSIFNYPIISYQRINVYRVEAKDMGIFRWKMVPVENAILVSTKVLIVSDKILW